jgi:hypothetical protein
VLPSAQRRIDAKFADCREISPRGSVSTRRSLRFTTVPLDPTSDYDGTCDHAKNIDSIREL